ELCLVDCRDRRNLQKGPSYSLGLRRFEALDSLGKRGQPLVNFSDLLGRPAFLPQRQKSFCPLLAPQEKSLCGFVLPIDALAFSRNDVRAQLIEIVGANAPGHVLLAMLPGQPSRKLEEERRLCKFDTAVNRDATEFFLSNRFLRKSNLPFNLFTFSNRLA